MSVQTDRLTDTHTYTVTLERRVLIKFHPHHVLTGVGYIALFTHPMGKEILICADASKSLLGAQKHCIDRFSNAVNALVGAKR